MYVLTDESMRGDMRMRGHESAFGVESRPPVSLRQLAFGVETRPREDDRLRFRGMEVPERRESRQKQAGSGTQSGCVQRLLAWDTPPRQVAFFFLLWCGDTHTATFTNRVLRIGRDSPTQAVGVHRKNEQ